MWPSRETSAKCPEAGRCEQMFSPEVCIGDERLDELVESIMDDILELHVSSAGRV